MKNIVKVRIKRSFVQTILISLFLVGCIFFSPRKVEASTVTLTPSTGVAGQVVIITGSAFDNSSTATITWDGSALTTVPSSVTTSGSGAIPASGTVYFTVPSGSYGAHTVQITTGATNIGVATFTISTPTVAISSPTIPTAGLPPGVPLTVTATNLEANRTTTFYFDNTSMGTTTSTVNGTAELVFNIPDVNNTSNHLIRASNSAYAVASATVVVATPAITVLPATSAVGTQVTITGTNFKAGGAVSFLFNGSSLTTDTSVTANGAGSFTTTFTVPASAAGSNTVKAYSYADLFAVATLTVSTPALTAAPVTGPDGLPVYLSGTGFKANNTVTFYVNNSLLSTTTTTNALGSFGVSVNLPEGLPAGAQTIRAQTDALNFANTTYTVVVAAVTTSPTAGAPGTRVTLNGSNFNPSKKVFIKWNGGEILADDKDLTTTAAGGFVATITIPTNYGSGISQIEVSTSAKNTVVTSFTVTAPTLTLSATSGGPGTRLTVAGANFVGNSEITLKWDDMILRTTPTDIMTTPLGGFNAIFTVPNSSRGSHYVTATTGANASINATTVFTISTPSISLSTSTGQPNTSISLSGTGFTPYGLVTLLWDNRTELSGIDGEIKADASGYFSTTLNIPGKASPGDHVLKAKSNVTTFAESTFTVSNAVMNASRTDGPAGSKIRLTGSNFDADSSVVFEWDDKKMSTAEVMTDSIGGFSTAVSIPDASAGVHKLEARSGEFGIAIIEFTINPPSLLVQPGSAKVGAEVTIIGSNFTVDKAVSILIGKRVVSTTPKTIIADGNGNFTAKVTVPYFATSPMVLGASTSKEGTAELSLPLNKSLFMPVTVTASGLILTIALILLVLRTFGGAWWRQKIDHTLSKFNPFNRTTIFKTA